MIAPGMALVPRTTRADHRAMDIEKAARLATQLARARVSPARRRRLLALLKQNGRSRSGRQGTKQLVLVRYPSVDVRCSRAC
jgi:hypothetical protein